MIKDLKEGNKGFLWQVKNFSNYKKMLKDLADNGQHPFALIITCSDSRVVPEYIFDKPVGNLFVIRTAGNVINEGELGTIEYAIEHLQIKTILVLGHTNCGAVHAAIHNEKGKYLDPILSKIKLAIGDEQDELLATTLNAESVKEFIKSKFPDYDGIVEKAIYDIKTGKVTFDKK
ncbi:MAG: hypothetical protein J6Y28_00650 [Acholeplasmatales bacterium]|nr:hypothetical protein [Acholeplasmatales bacterium]